MKIKEKQKSGFEDDDCWDMGEVCKHPNHYPPSHMVIPQGKRYRHVCPCCGHVSVIRTQMYYF